MLENRPDPERLLNKELKPKNNNNVLISVEHLLNLLYQSRMINHE